VVQQLIAKYARVNSYKILTEG